LFAPPRCREYRRWLEEQRALASITIEGHLEEARRFLAWRLDLAAKTGDIGPPLTTGIIHHCQDGKRFRLLALCFKYEKHPREKLMKQLLALKHGILFGITLLLITPYQALAADVTSYDAYKMVYKNKGVISPVYRFVGKQRPVKTPNSGGMRTKALTTQPD
jgi:hypothetical protein